MTDLGYPENEPLKEAKDLILKLLGSVKREGIDKVINYLQKTDYFTAPASTKFHGNFEGGLAEHSLFVYALFLMKNKCLDLGLDQETIIISALLHDLCKVDLYKKEFQNKKVYCEHGSKHDAGGNFDWVAVQSYCVDEKLPLGHGEKSVIILQGFMRLKREEIYLLRWHMGPFSSANEYDFNTACKVFSPCCALYTADMEATHIYEETRDLTAAQ
jgi:hypothetical protein